MKTGRKILCRIVQIACVIGIILALPNTIRIILFYVIVYSLATYDIKCCSDNDDKKDEDNVKDDDEKDEDNDEDDEEPDNNNVAECDIDIDDHLEYPFINIDD